MYVIYTDGAYSSKRNQGGVGIVVLKNNKVIQVFSKGYKNTTNNQMEMIAVMYALKSVKEHISKLTIITDSMYVIGHAVSNWKVNKNKALWIAFYKLLDDTKKLVDNIEFKHVKGHDGDKYNEMCDRLAVAASQENL